MQQLQLGSSTDSVGTWPYKRAKCVVRERTVVCGQSALCGGAVRSSKLTFYWHVWLLSVGYSGILRFVGMLILLLCHSVQVMQCKWVLWISRVQKRVEFFASFILVSALHIGGRGPSINYTTVRKFVIFILIPRIKCDYLLFLLKDCTTVFNSLASLLRYSSWHLQFFM